MPKGCLLVVGGCVAVKKVAEAKFNSLFVVCLSVATLFGLEFVYYFPGKRNYNTQKYEKI